MALGRQVGSLPAIARGSRTIALSPDGAQVLFADPLDANLLRIWDVRVDRLSSRLAAQGVEGLALLSGNNAEFSPDGSLLVTLGLQRGKSVLRLWDVEAGIEIATLTEVMPIEHLEGFRWAEDGRMFQTSGPSTVGTAVSGWWTEGSIPWGNKHYSWKDQFRSLWQVAYPVQSYRSDSPIRRLQFNARGTRLIVNDDVWQVVTLSGHLRLRRTRLHHLTSVIAQSFSRQYQVRDDPTSEIPLFLGGQDQVWAGVPADVSRIVAWSWPADRKSLAGLRQLAPQQRDLALPRGDYDVSGLGADREISAAHWHSVAFSPDGRYALLLRKLGIRLRSERVRETWKEHIGGMFASLGPLHALPFLLGKVDYPLEDFYPDNIRHVELWDLAKGKRLSRWSDDPQAAVLDFSPDSKRAALAGRNGIEIREVPTGQVERVLGPPNAVRVVFSHDGRRLLSLNRPLQGKEVPTLRLRLFDRVDGREIAAWSCDKGRWEAFALSPDGRRVASGDADGTLHLWDADTGKELAHWRGHEAGVTALAFHPDGNTFVSGSSDGTLKLWDLPAIRKELAALGLDW